MSSSKNLAIVVAAACMADTLMADQVAVPCQDLERIAKRRPVLANSAFHEVPDVIALGEIEASGGDFDYSKAVYYLVAPNGYADGAMPGNGGFTVELNRLKSACKAVTIFQAKFGIGYRNIGVGSFKFDYSLMLLNKAGAPVSVGAPRPVEGMVRAGWLGADNSLGTGESGKPFAVRFVNMGNAPLKVGKWTEEDTQLPVEVVENKCSWTDLNPGESCSVSFVVKQRDLNVAAWTVDVKGPSNTVEVILSRQDGGYGLSVKN